MSSPRRCRDEGQRTREDSARPPARAHRAVAALRASRRTAQTPGLVPTVLPWPAISSWQDSARCCPRAPSRVGRQFFRGQRVRSAPLLPVLEGVRYRQRRHGVHDTRHSACFRVPAEHRPGFNGVGEGAECEAGSNGRVLRNLVGITDPAEMEEAESDALVGALDRLVEALPADHRFTAEDVRLIHRTWLGGIYGWAGEYRSVDLSKPGIEFAHAEYIPNAMGEFERGPLARYTPCTFEERAQQVEALAVTHAELVVIDPFREGNGRCARMGTLMAAQAGLPLLDFGPMAGDGEERYFRGSETRGRGVITGCCPRSSRRWCGRRWRVSAEGS